MNDLEQRLKDMLGADASKAPTVQGAPERLRPKIRRRQIGTALVGSLAALALVAVSVAGFRALDAPDDPQPADDPWAGFQVFERTASLHLFTISSASDLYLVNPALDPVCSANFDCEFADVLQLSNYDPGLNRSACGAALPSGGAALVIRYDLLRGDEAKSDPEFPVTLDSDTPTTDGPCGPGRYARFQVQGIPYLAWLGTGEGIGEGDMEALSHSFEEMRTLPMDREMPDGDGLRAAYVIAGGENAAGPWRLDARPSPPGASSANVELALVGPERGSVVEGFGVPAVPIEQAGGDPTFGAVTQEAASVELRSEGIVEPARTVPLPPSLESDFDLFFGSHEGDVLADAVALGADGSPLGGSYVVPPIDVTHDGNYVLARFDAFGEAWELSAPRSGDGCSLRQIPHLFGGDDTCEVVITSSRGPQGHAFAYGTLPPGADTAQVVAADGTTYPCGVLTTGASGRRYFVIALEGGGPGEIQFLGADGAVVERYRDMTWGDPTR